MRNNLNSEFDAEWYLSVLQPNVFWIMRTGTKMWFYNPLGNIFFYIITLGWFFLLEVIVALFDMAGAMYYNIYIPCLDILDSV